MILLMNAQESISTIFSHRSDRLTHNITRNFIYSLFVSIILIIIDHIFSQPSYNNIVGYLICGCGIMYSAWWGEHLWFTIITPIIKKPFGWLSYLTRVPFWWMASGMGFIIGLLVSKKLGLFNFNEIPIITFFIFGGNLGIVIQILLRIPLNRILDKNHIFLNRTKQE